MTRKPKKIGDRVTIYLNSDVSPELLDWINNQSDLTMFFLYAAKELYKNEDVSDKDVAKVLPKIINYSLEKKSEKKSIHHKEEAENETNSTWQIESIENDPFA